MYPFSEKFVIILLLDCAVRALGARRANAVREYLSARGVAGSRIQTVSFGKERPVELCSRESCYSVNRRAVTLLDNLGS